MAEEKQQNVFGRIATQVDGFFNRTFYKIGMFVGTRPCTSIFLSFLFCILCLAGFSQVNSESRPEKLWIPQGTTAQNDADTFNDFFPPDARRNLVLLEAKGSSCLTTNFLLEAFDLHTNIEGITSTEGDTLDTLCVQGDPTTGHNCFISSVFQVWDYDRATIAADPDPVASINAEGWSQTDLTRILGDATFSGGNLVDAKAMTLSYFLNSNREDNGGDYSDPRGDAFEEEMLDLMGCDVPDCNDDVCACDYGANQFNVYAQAQRSFGDAFGAVISGDVGLINGAFMIMIVYLLLNLGGLCHKVNSRALLAFATIISIVLAGAAGYGLSMWLQFDYTPVHSVLPFVILGIGVDDSFVIVNAFDSTDKTLPVNKRIAQAISHAGVSIMVTSLTDFVAFAISVSSALPALSAFCMYAAFSVLMLFILQVTFFAALLALDTLRVEANRIDCCFCLPNGCPCCPTVSKEEAAAKIEETGMDPNQMLCKKPGKPKGRMAWLLGDVLAPQLVKVPVALGLLAFSLIFLGICIWQTTELSVQDTQRSFIPSDSYVYSTLDKIDRYFGTLGVSVFFVTQSGNYFSSQAALLNIKSEVAQMDYMQSVDGDGFSSWASEYASAIMASQIPEVTNFDAATGIANVPSEYYAGLSAWLAGAGSRFEQDIVWESNSDPQAGIRASRISGELIPVSTVENDKIIVDSEKAVEAMDNLRDAVKTWSGLPGGCFTYSYTFLTWETFRIIKRELYLSVGLCLVAVFFITLALIAHPLTSVLVFLSVLITIVDILGIINMWGYAIDNVSVIQIVISVGLCVDYAAHIGHNFMLQAGTRAERVQATMSDVGAAVLNGGFSTFLGVMLLAMSKSYVFRVLFATFFITVVLGLFHGMVLLPALLGLIGPDSYAGAGGHHSVKSAQPEAQAIGKIAPDDAKNPAVGA